MREIKEFEIIELHEYEKPFALVFKPTKEVITTQDFVDIFMKILRCNIPSSFYDALVEEIFRYETINMVYSFTEMLKRNGYELKEIK